MAKISKPRAALFATIAACAIALAGLTGCGSNANEANSAEEVYEHYSQTSHDNFVMDGDITMGVGAQGMTMEIPVKLHLETSEGNAYTEMDLTMFGMNSTSKTYLVKEGANYTSYSCSTSSTDSNETWTKNVVTDDSQSIEKLTNLEKTMFEGADFAKNENGYTVDIPLSKMMSTLQDAAESSNAEIEEMFNSLNSMGVNPDNIKISYSFDKDYNLTKMSIPETEIPFESEGVSGTVKLICDLNLSNHGNVQKIVVPEDILAKATEENSSFDSNALSMMDDMGESNSSSATSTTDDSAQKKAA